MTIYYSTFTRLVENYIRHPNTPNKPIIKDELKNANCDANKNGIYLDVIITTQNLGGLELKLKKDSTGDFDFDEVNYQDSAGKTHFYVNHSPGTPFVGSSWFNYAVVTKKRAVDFTIEVYSCKLDASVHKDASGKYYVSKADFYYNQTLIFSKKPPKKKVPAPPTTGSATKTP